MNGITKLMIDTAKGQVVNFSKGDAELEIRKQFNTLLGLSENASMKEIRRAIRKNKTAIFEIIEDTIDELLISGWGENPFFLQFVETINLNDGDKNEFYVPDDSILTMSKFSGNHHDLIRQKLGIGKSFSVTTSWYGIKVYEEFERYVAGRVDWGKYVTKLYEGVDKAVNDMLYGAFLGLKDFMPPAYAFSGDPTEEAILQRVEMVQTATGKEVVIAGPRTAIARITNLNNEKWSDEMINERNTLGGLGRWNGIQMMRIPQVFEQGTRNFKYDEKTFYILPLTDEKPIKFVYEGDPRYVETTDYETNRDMTIEAMYQTKMGFATIVGSDYAVGTFA
ncbi:hypothetical protein M2140_000142 [Clostridiales Family XIII bacterium PM5-7]